jgi:hypothetical protein
MNCRMPLKLWNKNSLNILKLRDLEFMIVENVKEVSVRAVRTSVGANKTLEI